MCGIVGVWNLNKNRIDQDELDKFTDRLAHRGPDGRGTYIDSSACLGLGHRRLAILDLTESGKQPMSYAKGRYWITFNGEIYNFLEIRTELESKGHRFISTSDTEVIIAAYIEWGEECQLRFNGMWAFAIWDNKQKVLFLSRDRFGVKPLHFIFNGQYFAFASEMKAFFALPWFQGDFNETAIAATLKDANNIESSQQCLLREVSRLQAGHCLTIQASDTKPVIQRWWNTLDHLEFVASDFYQQTLKFHDIFSDACKLRMRSDVPIATALSGGLDSSSVLCEISHINKQRHLEARLASNRQSAFVATYPETFQDEKVYAEQVVAHTQAQAFFLEIKPDEIWNELQNYVYKFEEIQDFHIGPWLIYREMRRLGIVVSLDGHGADECLAGYGHYASIGYQEAVKHAESLSEVFGWSSLIKCMRAGSSSFNLIENFYNTASYLTSKYQFLSKANNLRKKLFKSKEKRTANDQWLNILTDRIHNENYNMDYQRVDNWNPIDRALYLDFHYKILPTILRNFDRCSMAHGVEVRAPFMDWRLVRCVFSLPWSSKIEPPFTKKILRYAMRGILPESIRLRSSKIGFSNPFKEWTKYKAFKEFVLESVNSDFFLKSEIWNGPAIRKFVEVAYHSDNAFNVNQAIEYIQAAWVMKIFKKTSHVN